MMNGNDRDTKLNRLRRQARSIKLKIEQLEDGKNTILSQHGIDMLEYRRGCLLNEIALLADYQEDK